jgi:L-fucose mutarotase
LIADGNYPALTMTNPASVKVHLNLMPGVPTVSQVLEALASATVFQEAAVVAPPDDSFRAVHKEYAALLPGVKFQEMERFAFYDEVKSSNTGLVIVTADARRFANLLLTVGVVVDL